MLTGMRNIELHLMDSNGDVDLGVKAGLIEPEEVTDVECDNCRDEVGHVDGAFYPYVVALDDQSHWNVCEDCASGVLDSSPMYEEYDNFISDAND